MVTDWILCEQEAKALVQLCVLVSNGSVEDGLSNGPGHHDHGACRYAELNSVEND